MKMTKIVCFACLVLLSATTCTAQVSKDYCGEYKSSLDYKKLLASLTDTTSTKRTFSATTVTYASNPTTGVDFQKEVQQKTEEILDSHIPKGYQVDSSSMSKQTNAYGIITIKGNSIENANPMTKKTEVLYEWKNQDVSTVENGYQIKTASGEVITLERIGQTVRIPELYLILTPITE